MQNTSMIGVIRWDQKQASRTFSKALSKTFQLRQIKKDRVNCAAWSFLTFAENRCHNIVDFFELFIGKWFVISLLDWPSSRANQENIIIGSTFVLHRDTQRWCWRCAWHLRHEEYNFTFLIILNRAILQYPSSVRLRKDTGQVFIINYNAGKKIFHELSNYKHRKGVYVPWLDTFSCPLVQMNLIEVSLKLMFCIFMKCNFLTIF